MPLRHYPNRLLLAAALSSLLVLAVCAGVIAYLRETQVRTVDVLSEDIGSRGAAFNLETTLSNLLLLHQSGARDIAPCTSKSRVT